MDTRKPNIMIDQRTPLTPSPAGTLKAIAFGPPAESGTAAQGLKQAGVRGEVQRVADLDALTRALRTQPADLVICELSRAAYDGLSVPPRLLDECRAGRLRRMPAVLWISDLPNGVLDAYMRQLCRAGAIVGLAPVPEAVPETVRHLRSRLPTECDAASAAALRGEPSPFRDEQLISAFGSGGGLRVVLQPQVDLATGWMIGAEALVRWRHPESGEIPPSAMVEALDRLSLDALLFHFVTERVLELQSVMMSRGVRKRISVNASVATLSRPGVMEDFELRTRRAGVLPSLLTIEITEGVSIQDKTALEAGLRRLRACGFGVSMDDFGTGASNFSRLTRLPFSELKIDRSFIQRLHAGAASAAVVDAVMGLGRRLGLSIVAEGVETYAQVRHLRALGCEVGQGFGLGRPMECPDFLEVIVAQIPERQLRGRDERALVA